MEPKPETRAVPVGRVTLEMLWLSSYALMIGVAVALAAAGVVTVLAVVGA